MELKGSTLLNRAKIQPQSRFHPRFSCGALTALCLFCTSGLAQESTQPATVPETVTGTVPGGTVKIIPQEPIAGFTTADQLLTALETADQDLKNLTAALQYTKDFAIAGDTQVRQGTLWFEDISAANAKPGTPRKRRFAILFKNVQVGTRLDEKEQMYNFDGEWLVERFPSEKRMVKRQVVPPGESFDPLKIGEGPLPIPIGQRKDDILARYDATLLPPNDGFDELPIERMKKTEDFVKGTVQLLLVPRADQTDDFKEIRLWYLASKNADGTPGKLLPRMARTVNRAEDMSTVQLLNVKKNDSTPINATVFDTKTPDSGWEVTVMPFRGSIEEAGPTPAGANRVIDATTPGVRPENSTVPSSPASNQPVKPK